MWQLIVAAAVAQFIFNPFIQKPRKPNVDHRESCRGDEEQANVPVDKEGLFESEHENYHDVNDGFFRFSSCDSGEIEKGGSWSMSSLSLKSRFRTRGSKKKKSNGDEIEKRFSGCLEVNRKRVSGCLKKRRAITNDASKFRSCSWKDASFFRSGLGVGIMYMTLAGISEIGKLNTTVYETAKVVQELRDELYRRKLLQDGQASVSADSDKTTSKDNNPAVNKSGSRSSGFPDVKLHYSTSADDGEYPSSVLTEEPETVEVDMDRLETELESELQKLNLTDLEDDKMKELEEPNSGSESYQCGGVSATELENRLCHLLIEQQENQIEELESELQTAQSKLHQKETELHSLKDCIRRLTDLSFSNSSDEEENQKLDSNQECDPANPWNHHPDTEQNTKRTVGKKRHINS